MTSQISDDARTLFIERSRGRFYTALDYLIFFLYVAFVSISAFAVDYLIVVVIEHLLSSTIHDHSIVSKFFDWFKIGSAFLALIAAAVHAVFSAWSQIRFEIKTLSEH